MNTRLSSWYLFIEAVKRERERERELLLKTFYFASLGHEELNGSFINDLAFDSFGKVKTDEHLFTGHNVAIKILNRRKIKNMQMEEKVGREINILRLFMHPHIIRQYEVIEIPNDI
ncbi:unnamed protein product [Eruca vesicaria subsp. sativa]|uniref:Protein kinase domain-containing protein n=1 Tax=Eruca vesicaria subsp. sativa TaxID=29727 RepID=A0ABC8IPV1_ERUVS|nr:unnamed protein product [Eruca vesicaria subsp. sativa]